MYFTFRAMYLRCNLTSIGHRLWPGAFGQSCSTAIFACVHVYIYWWLFSQPRHYAYQMLLLLFWRKEVFKIWNYKQRMKKEKMKISGFSSDSTKSLLTRNPFSASVRCLRISSKRWFHFQDKICVSLKISLLKISLLKISLWEYHPKGDFIFRTKLKRCL